MLLDLLRLVSLGQNMELYASLQIRQPPQTNANQQTQHQSARPSPQSHRPRQTTSNSDSYNNQPSNSYHNQSQNFRSEPRAQPQDYRPPTRETEKQQAAQCKPLDLSLKSAQSTFSHQDSSSRFKSEHDEGSQQRPLVRHRKSRPAPLKRSFVEKCADEEEEETNFEGSRQQQRNSCIKLISSSTSPSSTSSSFAASSCFSSSSCSTRLTRVSCSSNEEVSTLDQSKRSPITHEVISTSTDSSAGGQRGTGSGKRQKSPKGDNQVKSHLCLQCGRSFSRSDMLTRHSRLHSGLKPYQCGECKQVFSRSDHLSTHERTHTGEKPYQCEQCAYSACRRDMITRHMRTHNSARNSSASGLRRQRRVGKKTSTARRMKRKLSMALDSSTIERPNCMDDYAIVEGSSDQLHHNMDDISTSLNGEDDEEGEQIEDEEVQELGLRF